MSLHVLVGMISNANKTERPLESREGRFGGNLDLLYENLITVRR
jgi:hypothetical protein